VPRLIASVIPDPAEPALGAVWLDTHVELPDDAPSEFRDVFTGATIVAERGGTSASTIPAATLFAQLPVALLVAT
jgi:(1->4)-alpha-D-glucan 1-alpha-D-glucosylmutase